MENPQPFVYPIVSDKPASSRLAEEKPAVDIGQASTPRADEVVESLPPPPLPVASASESTPILDAKDELDARLAKARVSRAITFSKVTNLFNKIFAE